MKVAEAGAEQSSGIDNRPGDSRDVVKEPCGPLLPHLKLDDIEDVIRRANATDYGLAAMVSSRDVVEARAIDESMEAGTVWITEIRSCSPHLVLVVTSRRALESKSAGRAGRIH